ncbi:hypothetical protein [Mangrovimonas spongiae]|uniref:Uncharacterized protein n=1 Tax=Mangrovimonas spongiae TaxID=2494697 RepID=A0A428K0R8_9FLAO|nr:hypothetical protein [Mangrovimonas spongiae]RSK39967.1 hypothetical protein EJA19_08785 [Mangrovimonas spongiae]
MSENKFYICGFCYEEYVPTRRGAQKYCSDTCRSKAYHHRKKAQHQEQTENKPTPLSSVTSQPLSQEKIAVEKMSFAGVGNAALGQALAESTKTFLTKKENRPATKKDINTMVSKIKGRYHLITNMSPKPNGQRPYYDIERKEVVYRWTK